MLIHRLAAGIVCAVDLHLAAGVACAQTYPYKPLRIFTSAAGGNNDFNARIIAQGISGSLGQPVIVDNRGALPATELALQAQPDGYTLLVAATSFIVGPLLQKMPYEPLRDFAPVTMTASSPNVLVLHPSVPANTVAELIALAKAKPGTLNYASGTAGTSAHLAAELFKNMTGVNIVRIPYKGDGPAISALIGGEVQMMLVTAGSIMPYMKANRLKAIAVTTARPTALVPGVPTVTDSGVPGYESVQASGVFAPVKTPAAIVARLNKEIVAVLNRPDVKEKYFNIGAEIVADSPQQFAVKIKSETARMGKVIKEAGIRAE